MLPEKVKVGAVEYSTSIKSVIEINGERHYAGSCDFGKSEIEILDILSSERKQDVYVHEMTHAIFYEAGFEEQEEDMINRVGKVLHQVLKDNTNFFGNKRKYTNVPVNLES